MDEISQDPKLNVRLARRRWLDVAVAVTLIAAAVIAVMTGRGSGPAGSPAAGPGAAAAPALLPSTVRTRIPLPFGQPGGMTILGSTAWISDWSASQIAGVDLTTRRVIRTLRIGGQQDEPVSMTAGAGSVWVLDFAGPLLRIDPASGAITKRFPVRGLGADVAYGDGFIWMITDEPTADGDQKYLYKIDPSRDVIVKAAPIPGAGPACAASPGPQGIWIGCAGVDQITLISQGSLKPVQSLRVDSGEYTPQIVPGQQAVWVLTPSGLARADPATARITAIIHVGYAPSAMSAPALVMDAARSNTGPRPGRDRTSRSTTSLSPIPPPCHQKDLQLHGLPRPRSGQARQRPVVGSSSWPPVPARTQRAAPESCRGRGKAVQRYSNDPSPPPIHAVMSRRS
jgi:hypothetical protein